MSASEFQLSLVNASKSAGADKYKCIPSDKESFVYVPQNLSRTANKPAPTMSMTISTTDFDDSIMFELVKTGKTGDDRYKLSESTVVTEPLWKGDIYVGHQFRNSLHKIYVNVKQL
jgi:hypothetical protein